MAAAHFIDDNRLKQTIARALRDSGRRRLNADMRAAEVLKAVDAYLDKQPLFPPAVGVAEAAEVLGLPKPRIYRLQEQGRMPEPVLELQSGPLFLRAEVEALAAELNTERAERERRRAEREEVPA